MNDIEIPRLSPEQKNQLDEQVKQMLKAQVMKEFSEIQSDMDAVKNDADDPSNEKKVKTARDIPQSVKDKGNNKQVLQTATEVVRRTLLAIKNTVSDPPVQQEPIDLPSGTGQYVLRSLANTIDVNDINQRNVIYLNEIIQRAFGGGFSDPQSIVQVFDSVRNLQFIDSYLYRKISETFQNTVLNLGGGASESEKKAAIEKLKTSEQKEEEKKGGIDTTPEQTYRRQKETEDAMKEISEIIQDITPQKIENSNLYDDIEQRLRRISDPDMRRIERDLSLSSRSQVVQNELREAMLKIVTPRDSSNGMRMSSQEDINKGVEEFDDLMKRYVHQGLFSMDTYEVMRRNLGRLASSSFELAKIRESEKSHSMAYMIQQSEIWDPKEKELLLALDDPKALERLIEGKRYKSLSQNGWDNFQQDIESVFNRIFDIAASRPDDFWNEALSEIYEGHYIKLIIQRISNLSEQLKQYDFGKRKVEMEDFYAYADTFKIEETPGGINPRLIGIKKMHPSFAEALGVMAARMIDDKRVFEFIHNVNNISNLGLGFDKLAEYSSRVKMQDIDRLFYKNPDLVEAYKFYLQNMYQELSLNYHIMNNDFGLQDYRKLDKIEQRTYKQLAAKLGEKELDNKRIIRMIKMASGIAKGVTGEFWGAALTARLPMDYKAIYDEKTGKIKHHEITTSYQSLNNSGLEKMLWQIDMDLLLQRFNLPRYWPELRYGFAPRNFDDEEVCKRYANTFDHADFYNFKNMADRAVFDGRPDELVKADEDYNFFHERFRTSSIDYFLRGGWRFKEIRRYFTYKRDEKSGELVRDAKGRLVVDFNATVKQLEGIGPYAVKYFIDDLFDESDWSKEAIGESKMSPLDYTQIDPQEIRAFKSDYNPEKVKKISAKDKIKYFKDIKEFFYHKYIFQRLEAIRPTQFILMEAPRFMPEGEKRLSDRLSIRLQEIYKGKYDKGDMEDFILPLYIGAVELVENELWREHKAGWKTKIASGDWSGDSPFNYKITAADFDKKEIYEKLIAYFHLTQGQTGVLMKSGRTYVLKDEDFLDHLKTFFQTLREGIDDPTRKNLVKDGVSQTLSRRYAHMMVKKMGYIDHYLKGNLFDFGEFYLQQGGSRGTERMMGETAGIATKSTVALRQIITESIPELVKRTYNNQHELEKAVQELLSKPFKEWFDGIAIIDPNQAMGDAKYLMAYISAMIGKDRKMRWKLIGDIEQDFARRMWGTQGSFMTDHFKFAMDRPTTAFDSDQIWTVVHTLSNLINLPHDESRVTSYKKNALGINVPATTTLNPHSFEQIEKVLGVTKTKRIIEAAPMIGPIIILILFLLAKLALDKNKKN